MLLAAALVFFSLGGTDPASQNQGIDEPDAAAYFLAVIAAAAVVLWRWRPWWTFLVTGAATVTYMALGYAFGPILFSTVFAIYGLASRVPTRKAIKGTGALVVAGLAAAVLRVGLNEAEWSDLWSTPAWLLVPAAVGIALRIRRESAAEIREAEAKTAVSEERLRMAQEIHDTVGHGLAVIAMHAGVALHILDRDPVKARESLDAIRTASRQSLDELRAELDVLRGADTPYEPSVGVRDLPGLVDRIRASGLAVSLDVGRDAGHVRAEAGFATYRIVQESLTNVLRHGGPEATARVTVKREGDGLMIEVSDTGRGVTTDADGRDGHGVAGMQQRAEDLGGTFSAGPEPDGAGFIVSARLPLR